MVGSGIFLLPASLAAYGGISIFGWLFTATGGLFIAGAGLCPFEWHHAEDGWALYLHPGRLR